MKFITETELQAARFADLTNQRRYITASANQAQLSIFLSHSHKDRRFVEGLIVKLASLGIRIYVDWNDSSMPRITSKATAAILKTRMRECDLFMVLATRNAVESKWVPWETGVADQMKGESRMTIVPVADPTGRFAGAEYLGLYPRLALGLLGRFHIFEPETDRDLGQVTDYFGRFAK